MRELPSGLDAALRLAARVCISVIFITSGIAKLVAWHSNLDYVAAHGVPFRPVMLALATAVELVGAACVISGFRAQLAGAVMAAYLAFVTVVFHRLGSTDFQKNVAIVGALLMVAACGPGRWSLVRRAPTACRARTSL